MTDDAFRDPHKVRISNKTYGEMTGRDTSKLPPRTDEVLIPDDQDDQDDSTPVGAYGPEETGDVDPMQMLGEGMRPMPEGTDMDRLIAAYDLIGRMGMADFEVGFDDSQPADTWWYAQCRTGDDQVFVVTGKAAPELAAEGLARKLANGGRCTHCGKVTTLWTQGTEESAGVGQQNRSWVCYWERRGKMWHRGCEETHAEGQRTKEAINEFIDRTNSPARKEV